ncbi:MULTISPECIES: cytochrome c-type biogenesis protein [Ensifer]|jgi:cytochrome c-type biogenesis protein CcmH|uniref:Cytochrome c-type biogenesis protein n=1 Tax=Ensifer canadensis TaxID=555315 RepID=A0AAW4FST8_9HYPH|nr:MULTISPECIES: cytochrome c-type biogenesis protein [Ensifer]AHK43785.1 cytochrome c-type biogenesis protein CycL precursor [Ensifer adhaerens OV14]MDP9627967.1 cytochrome c-type biogenesis protein CcmH [Ensifer adhaerens]KQU72141.1 cytochrome C [Ensifer sp. Root31]KQW44327.1 cytochrome C [Ensifer sp. Root1252]KQW84494.1 cytochrome C [Ensifer sp. Root127]
MNRLLLAFFLFLASLGPTFAVNPDEVLSDPALEARARAISAELRCMVCQNQSIDDSNAELAKDLRVLVRERLANGDSDEAVIDYVVSRYGEFVLLKPRFETKTMILWGMPILLLLVGAATLLVAALKRGRQSRGTPLSDDEKEKLKKLLQP